MERVARQSVLAKHPPEPATDPIDAGRRALRDLAGTLGRPPRLSEFLERTGVNLTTCTAVGSAGHGWGTMPGSAIRSTIQTSNGLQKDCGGSPTSTTPSSSAALVLLDPGPRRDRRSLSTRWTIAGC